MLPEVKEIKDAIKLLTDELREIQSKCTHSNITYEYDDNYDSWADIHDFYVSIACKDCGWHTIYNQGQEHYRVGKSDYTGTLGSVSKEEI